jgi:hypothetical protein
MSHAILADFNFDEKPMSRCRVGALDARNWRGWHSSAAQVAGSMGLEMAAELGGSSRSSRAADRRSVCLVRHALIKKMEVDVFN